MSVISFNFSTATDKSWMKDYNEPLQIMPQTTKIPTDEIINSYPKCVGIIRDSVIHTSYITRPFGDIYNNGRINTFRYNIIQYTKLCKQLQYKRLLIHLPQTESEMNNIGNGMSELIKIFSNKENISLNDKDNYIILVLEIPAFKAGFDMNILEYFTIIVSNFFDKFKYNNIELCFDTAHLFANGLDSEDIINLFETKIKDKKLIDYSKIIHFNGNQNRMGKSDKHIQMFSPYNKMTNTNKLVNYLKDKNKILITENTTSHSNYNDWLKYAKDNNINIVSNNSHLSA